MEQITTKYRFETPNIHLVAGAKLTDIEGMYTLLQQEGCPNGENKFTDEPKAIYLDAIQTRIAKRNKANTNSSMDFVLCVVNHKAILVDAKFNAKHVDNLKKHDIDQKIAASRAILCFDNYSLINKFYILFKNSILNESQKNKLKRQFLQSPNYSFVTAIELYDLFE